MKLIFHTCFKLCILLIHTIVLLVGIPISISHQLNERIQCYIMTVCLLLMIMVRFQNAFTDVGQIARFLIVALRSEMKAGKMIYYGGVLAVLFHCGMNAPCANISTDSEVADLSFLILLLCFIILQFTVKHVRTFRKCYQHWQHVPRRITKQR